MKAIPTSESTNAHGMDKMNSSIYFKHEPTYVNRPSYNANQSNVEIDNYTHSTLQNTHLTKQDYQQLQG